MIIVKRRSVLTKTRGCRKSLKNEKFDKKRCPSRTKPMKESERTFIHEFWTKAQQGPPALQELSRVNERSTTPPLTLLQRFSIHTPCMRKNLQQQVLENVVEYYATRRVPVIQSLFLS